MKKTILPLLAIIIYFFINPINAQAFFNRSQSNAVLNPKTESSEVKKYLYFKNALGKFRSIFTSRKFLQKYNITQENDGIYVIEIYSKKIKDKLIPVVVDELETNESIYNRLQPRFAVNTGFFDPKNQKTVSYVTIDEKIVLDPNENENLMNNEALEPYMDKILNRSEFRILTDDNGEITYDICAHNSNVQEGLKIKHAIQAGPMLIPDLNLEQEFFILVRDGKIISESASSLHKYARTAIGIRENNVFLFIITNDNPMNLEEVAELTKKWGMEKAMAFDGGGSTSFDSNELHIISEKDNQARKLKSFLILLK